jgi:hypothetical protein
LPEGSKNGIGSAVGAGRLFAGVERFVQVFTPAVVWVKIAS